MKYCQNCELEYDDKFSFCKKCGSKLEVKEEKKACSKCGKELSAESGFCPFCGTEVKQNKTNVENSISLDNKSLKSGTPCNSSPVIAAHLPIKIFPITTRRILS